MPEPKDLISVEAHKIVACRDALVEGDYVEAYHQLCQLTELTASNPLEPWTEIENAASLIDERPSEMTSED
ncbi:MAG: hypothetical protein GY947_12425 [Rhodobacteraceae bacterium]|nr:hypothetical protein [Paracoccaceae bacterium]